jgi:hypothetical protein
MVALVTIASVVVLSTACSLERPASHSARDLRHDLARDQLYLAWLVTHWPEVDSLAPREGITGQQLGALGR